MTTTLDSLDAFFAQQTARLEQQLDIHGGERFYGRGTDPARMEGDAEAAVQRAYTRRETTPIPYNQHRGNRRRGQ